MNTKRFGWCLAVLLMQPAWASSRDDLMTSQIVEEARTWQRKGRDDLAADAWHRLLVTNPQHAEALVSLGLIMVKSGEISQAKALYARASRAKVTSYSMSKLAIAVGEVKDEVPINAVPSIKSVTQRSKKPRTEKTSAQMAAKITLPSSSAKRENVTPTATAEPIAVKITPLPTPQINTKVEPKLDPGPPQEPGSGSKTSTPKPRPVKPLPYFSDL
jgi:hypothetical protein